MPIVRNTRIETGSDELGTFQAELLSDTGGLTQFGAFIETLTPGSASSKQHWHRSEDEMVYILTGTVTLIEGDSVTPMFPGDAATFKAGVPVGHCLRNDGDTDARYFVIGARLGADVVTYTQTGETVTIADGVQTYRDADGTITKTAPYHGA